MEKFSVRGQLSKRPVDNISTRDKDKRREARFFLGFDKGYLEKLETRKKLTARGEFWSRWTRVQYAEKFKKDLLTADNVRFTPDGFSLTLELTPKVDSLADKDLTGDTDSLFYNGRQKPPSAQQCAYFIWLVRCCIVVLVS